MPTTWKPGDKVRLATGGPEMTVRRQYTAAFGKGEVVICQWFDKDGNLQKSDFAPESLVPAS
jgi:uncharacterized protein YodC (DUF2158 family)